jgi:hypothetical protein
VSADAGIGSDGFETGAGWLVTGVGSVCFCAPGSDGALFEDEEGRLDGGGTEEFEDESESLRTYTRAFLSLAPASPRNPRPRPPRPLSEAPRPVGWGDVDDVAGVDWPVVPSCALWPRPAPLPKPPRPRPRSLGERLSGL